MDSIMKKWIFLTTMHLTKNTNDLTQEEEINGYYNLTKREVDSHDKKCFYYSQKTNR